MVRKMDDLLEEKYRDNLGHIKDLVKDSNYRACRTRSSTMTMVSIFLDYMDGVFISEFFEWLFDNLSDVERNYDIEKDDKANINKIIINFIDLLIESIPIGDTNKIKIVDAMRDTRYEATKLQIKYSDQKPKMRRPPFIEELIGEGP